MSNRKNWVGVRVNEAKRGHSLVTGVAEDRIKELLTGFGGERQLRASELTEIASLLVADLDKGE